MSTPSTSGALEAVDRILNRGGDADDVLRLVVAHEQLHADPRQQHAADHLEVGQAHQVGGERRERRHQHDHADDYLFRIDAAYERLYKGVYDKPD